MLLMRAKINQFGWSSGLQRDELKLVASIVTISGINLLAAFMDLLQISDRDLLDDYCPCCIHSLGVLLALMDYVTSKAKVC